MHRDEEIRLLCSKLAAAIVTKCGARDSVCALGAEYDKQLEEKRTKHDLLDWGKQMQWIGGSKCSELALERGGNGLGKASPAAQHCVMGLTVDVISSMR